VKAFVQKTWRFAAAVVIVGGIVVFYTRVVKLNPTTVALSFLLAVLVVSANWGLTVAVFMSFVAALAFNFFFLPPVGTFTIAETQNWVALLAFLFTAVMSSNLSERVRREARTADGRRREVERLYSFSQRLLVTENIVELLNALPGYLVETFGARIAALYVIDHDRSIDRPETIARSARKSSRSLQPDLSSSSIVSEP
jgi:two-component system, OmpR family, sensor histidine kinase KdpD